MLLSSSSLTEFANRLQAMIFINRQDVQLANEDPQPPGRHSGQAGSASVKRRRSSARRPITTQRTQARGLQIEVRKLVAEAQTAIEPRRRLADRAQQRQSAQGQ